MRVKRPFLPRRLLAGIVVGALILAGSAAASMPRLLQPLTSALAPRCLTPAATEALQKANAAGVLEPVLRGGFALEGVAIGAREIEVKIQDPSKQTYAVILAQPGARSGQPDGEGQRFLFYVTMPSPIAAEAKIRLLAIAELFDAAIPDSALVRCSGGDAAHVDRRYPRTQTLVSALLEVSVLVAAALFGLGVVRGRGEGA